MRNYSEMKSHAVIAGILITSVFASTSPAVARNQSMVCRGEMGNGYLTTDPQYKVYAERKFYLTIQCSWSVINVTKSGPCDYTFEGQQHKGYRYEDGGFDLKHLGPFHIMQPDGYLTFKMSETTNGAGGNEGQRWFRGICTERNQ